MWRNVKYYTYCIIESFQELNLICVAIRFSSQLNLVQVGSIHILKKTPNITTCARRSINTTNFSILVIHGCLRDLRCPGVLYCSCYLSKQVGLKFCSRDLLSMLRKLTRSPRVKSGTVMKAFPKTCTTTLLLCTQKFPSSTPGVFS